MKAVSKAQLRHEWSRAVGGVRVHLTCGPGKGYAESQVQAGSHVQQLTFDCRSLKHSQEHPMKKPHAANAGWRGCPHLANTLGATAFAMESGLSQPLLIGNSTHQCVSFHRSRGRLDQGNSLVTSSLGLEPNVLRAVSRQFRMDSQVCFARIRAVSRLIT